MPSLHVLNVDDVSYQALMEGLTKEITPNREDKDISIAHIMQDWDTIMAVSLEDSETLRHTEISGLMRQVRCDRLIPKVQRDIILPVLDDRCLPGREKPSSKNTRITRIIKDLTLVFLCNLFFNWTNDQ